MKKIILIVACIILLNACTHIEPQYIPVETTSTNNAHIDNIVSEPENLSDNEETIHETEIKEDCFANIVFAGDNLIHSPIYNQAKRRGNGENYDFNQAYSLVKPYIDSADFAVLNQETVINSLYEPSSFPQFSSPIELGDYMIDLGFDAFSIANNHVFDVGADGLLNSFDFWQTKDVVVYGAYRNEEDLDNIRTAEINGIKFAFVGFMEHTNGLAVAYDSDIKVVYLSNEELMEKQIKKASAIADVVVVSVHFGVEVINDVTHQQRELSQKFADWGADLIIGTQPHTIQTMEYLDKNDGGQAFVFYCLGNFISAMNKPIAMVEMLGDITLKKNGETGEITIEQVKAIPLISQYDSNYSDVRIIPFSQYTEQNGYAHGVREYGEFNKDFSEKLIRNIIPAEFLCIE